MKKFIFIFILFSFTHLGHLRITHAVGHENSNIVELQSLTKYKKYEMHIGNGETAERNPPFSYFYNDGKYKGTLLFQYIERRPSSTKRYAWYAIYRGVVSTGNHIIPNTILQNQ